MKNHEELIARLEKEEADLRADASNGYHEIQAAQSIGQAKASLVAAAAHNAEQAEPVKPAEPVLASEVEPVIS